nr:hypothetical protein [Paenibacillus sacheonensis]
MRCPWHGWEFDLLRAGTWPKGAKSWFLDIYI